MMPSGVDHLGITLHQLQTGCIVNRLLLRLASNGPV